MNNLFDPFPTIETPRLVLREITQDDAPAFLAVRSDPEVMRYWSSAPVTSIEPIREAINQVIEGVRAGSSIRWAIADKSTGAFLGSGGFWRWEKKHLRAEIGYDLGSAHWGKGLATEALGAMIRFGWDVMKLHSVEANVDPRNRASTRVLEKLGFVQEGLLRENFMVEGQLTDTAIYSLLAPPGAGS
ncbi:MAG: GNAT family N-acetyltransferase [Byssovorax sp.]